MASYTRARVSYSSRGLATTTTVTTVTVAVAAAHILGTVLSEIDRRGYEPRD